MKQINIDVPEKKDLVRWIKILRFKLSGGFSCNKCGEKSNFNAAHFDSTINGKRFIFENRTKGICPDCTIRELNEKADIVFTEDDCKCDWCGEHKKTMSFPRHKALESIIHFGSQWWNGHHICQDCLNVCFANRGPVYSSHSKHKKGKLYQRNELGLWIKVK